MIGEFGSILESIFALAMHGLYSYLNSGYFGLSHPFVRKKNKKQKTVFPKCVLKTNLKIETNKKCSEIVVLVCAKKSKKARRITGKIPVVIGF